MSTRYVWNCQNMIGLVKAEVVHSMTTPVTKDAFGHYGALGFVSTDYEHVYDNNGALSKVKPSGIVKIIDTFSTTDSPNKIDANVYKYFFPISLQDQATGAWGLSFSSTGTYWYIRMNYSTYGTVWCPYVQDLVQAGTLDTLDSMSSDDLENRSSNLTRNYIVQEADSLTTTKVSSATSNKYPTTSGGAQSGGHWYTFQGSDSIDPTAVSYSNSKPKPGESVTVTITPCSNTYGGTVSYQYQYSTNGGSSWQNAGSKTTDKSKAITIPANAAKFCVRVLASDDMGFTSTTYVTGATLNINSAPTAPASVSLPARVSSEQSFTVNWAASSDAEGNLSGYQVERSYDGGATWISVSNSVKTASITDQVTAGNKTVTKSVSHNR